ncbi:MAG: HAD-IIB family hydrolase [Candidatus Heimdallarchaeota archaeon]|nr:HAD-IIB family hydrolase [Candidatus Heimdallarchaeota archaeon]
MERIVLFDVDGTLTKPRNKVDPKMLEFLEKLREKVTIGIVGGSDLVKIKEQMGEDVLNRFTYVFSENGLMAHKNGKLFASQSLKDYLGEEKLKSLINFVLKYVSELDIPIKRGTFIEFRNGMLNISPIGRNCSQKEREEFEIYDSNNGVRKSMVAVLEEKFKDLDLKYSIGGQISFDVFPKGWDKTYCLQYLKEFDEILFLGDKTYEGGNDFEIYTSDRTEGISVTSPDDTITILSQRFL